MIVNLAKVIDIALDRSDDREGDHSAIAGLATGTCCSYT